jgi:hypothetical protein
MYDTSRANQGVISLSNCLKVFSFLSTKGHQTEGKLYSKNKNCLANAFCFIYKYGFLIQCAIYPLDDSIWCMIYGDTSFLSQTNDNNYYVSMFMFTFPKVSSSLSLSLPIPCLFIKQKSYKEQIKELSHKLIIYLSFQNSTHWNMDNGIHIDLSVDSKDFTSKIINITPNYE